MRALRPKPSPAVLLLVGSRCLRGLPVLVHEASRRVWGPRLRRTEQELAISLPPAHVAFSQCKQSTHRNPPSALSSSDSRSPGHTIHIARSGDGMKTGLPPTDSSTVDDAVGDRARSIHYRISLNFFCSRSNALFENQTPTLYSA